MFSFNLDTKQWRRHLSGSVAHPAPRRFHAATFYATSMAISGGMNDTTVMQDVWFFNTISENWSQVNFKQKCLKSLLFTRFLQLMRS